MSNDAYYFIPVTPHSLPFDMKGLLAEDVFVYLPTSRNFVVFVQKGEKFTFAKQAALKKHLFPFAFLRYYPATQSYSAESESASAVSRIMENETLSDRGAREICDICLDLFQATGAAAETAVVRLEKHADEILEAVAPDVKNIRNTLLDNLNYLWLMNDAAAIAAIATLFAHAVEIGVESRKPIRDLVCATLIMDFPLAEIGQDHMSTYYSSFASLSETLKQEIRQHPIEAYRMAQRKLDHFSEATLELILNHHELYNGKGFPKGTRIGTLSPFVQVFSLAVDVFERLKQAQISQQAVTINDIVLGLREKEVDPHARRHNKKIVDQVIHYLGLEVVT